MSRFLLQTFTNDWHTAALLSFVTEFRCPADLAGGVTPTGTIGDFLAKTI